MDYNARAKKRNKNKKNKYPQEKNKQKILTVCYGNLHRSRVGEWLLHKNYTVDSCGIGPGAIQRIRRKLIEWADKIIVMEQYLADHVACSYPGVLDKIITLEIEDPMCINEALVIELHSKLNALGFETLPVEDIDKAVENCRKWVDNKIHQKRNTV